MNWGYNGITLLHPFTSVGTAAPWVKRPWFWWVLASKWLGFNLSTWVHLVNSQVANLKMALSGWWFFGKNPVLKNRRLRQLGWWHQPKSFLGKCHIHGNQKPPTRSRNMGGPIDIAWQCRQKMQGKCQGVMSWCHGGSTIQPPKSSPNNALLVGGPGPPRPEKYESIGMMRSQPFIWMGKCQIDGNQTTNQLNWGKWVLQVSSQWVWQDGCFFLKNPLSH